MSAAVLMTVDRRTPCSPPKLPLHPKPQRYVCFSFVHAMLELQSLLSCLPTAPAHCTRASLGMNRFASYHELLLTPPTQRPPSQPNSSQTPSLYCLAHTPTHSYPPHLSYNLPRQLSTTPPQHPRVPRSAPDAAPSSHRHHLRSPDSSPPITAL